MGYIEGDGRDQGTLFPVLLDDFLLPMAEAAKRALGVDNFQIVADAGYSNGEHFAQCEAAGMTPYVPVMITSAPVFNLSR